MAWNEPRSDQEPDPHKENRRPRESKEFSDTLTKLSRSLKALWNDPHRPNKSLVKPIAGAVAVSLISATAWASTYVIQPAERGLVLRFGSFATSLEPGLHFRLPAPVEQVEVVNIDEVRSIDHKGSMLTKDENIVEVRLTVQYKVKDAAQYRFNVLGPELTLQQATESALREVVGQNAMDYILTEGRADIASNVREVAQKTLDQYQAGVEVTSVNIQAASAPEAVKSAFDDAIKAREDEQRLINEAEAYRNEVLPKARGNAARIRQEADAHREGVIAKAQGETDHFANLLVEYQKAPYVTRQRLYIDAVESVLSKASKVLMDGGSDRQMVYLPIDKLSTRPGAAQPVVVPAEPPLAMPVAPVLEKPPADMRQVANARLREAR